MAKKKPIKFSAHKAEQKNNVSAEKVAECISQIKQAWNRQVQSIIETGKLLIQTKAELGHGRFTDIFKEGKLPFKERTAERLMQIAEHKILSNPTYVSDLPPHWGTLYEIAVGIPDEELERLLQEGKINADTEMEDVNRIVEAIEKDGMYDYSRVPQALNVLIEFMHKHPEPRAVIVYAVLEGVPDEVFKEEMNAPNLDDLKRLVGWIDQLQQMAETEYEKQEKEEAESTKEVNQPKLEEPEGEYKTQSLFEDKPAEEMAEVS